MAADTQTFRTWIKASPEAVWAAITDREQNGRYGYLVPVDIELRPGGAYRCSAPESWMAMGMPAELIDGEVAEVSAPNRLVTTWHPMFSPEMTAEPASTLTYEIEGLLHGVTKVTITHGGGAAAPSPRAWSAATSRPPAAAGPGS